MVASCALIRFIVLPSARCTLTRCASQRTLHAHIHTSTSPFCDATHLKIPQRAHGAHLNSFPEGLNDDARHPPRTSNGVVSLAASPA